MRVLVVAFALIEPSLRVVLFAPVRFFYPQQFYDFDHEMGHALRPGQTAFTHDHPVQINFLGLGDSQTFGNDLSLSDTRPKQLERRMQQMHNIRWEVINAGIPGH